MYQYIWEAETGGLLLTNEQSKFSKEPRPVYYKELDILGFDKYWRYPKDESAPIMWAEANNYIYKGRTIARTKGGTLYCAPELIVLEDADAELELVDIDEMVKKNSSLIENLAQETIQNIYNTYRDYKEKVDVFYIAFSGGKDSVVALDLWEKDCDGGSCSFRELNGQWTLQVRRVKLRRPAPRFRLVLAAVTA